MGRLIAAAAGALVGAAVAKELDKPVDKRGWHGDVAGIPYDFRRPTADKLLRSAWDPDNPEMFVPHAFGVGWSVNFARVAEWIQPPPAATLSPGSPELDPAPVPPALPAAGPAEPAEPAEPLIPAATDAPDAPVDPAPSTEATRVVPVTPATTADPGAGTPVGEEPAAGEPWAAAEPPSGSSSGSSSNDTATPAAAADGPATPAGPPDATGDSRG